MLLTLLLLHLLECDRSTRPVRLRLLLRLRAVSRGLVFWGCLRPLLRRRAVVSAQLGRGRGGHRGVRGIALCVVPVTACWCTCCCHLAHDSDGHWQQHSWVVQAELHLEPKQGLKHRVLLQQLLVAVVCLSGRSRA